MESIKILLANALKRRAELAMESSALDRIIELYRRVEAEEAAAADTSSDQMGLWDRKSARRMAAGEIDIMMDETRRLILAEQRPLKRGQLVKMLDARGFHVIGSDKNKVFGTNIWRSGKFIQVPGEGYWPNDVELPSSFVQALDTQ